MELLKTISYLFNIFPIALLAFGVLFTTTQRSYKDKNWLLAYFSCFLSIEILQMFIGQYLEINTSFLFILVFFIQFLFLTYFYCSIIFQVSSTRRNTTLCLGLLPFLIYTLPEPYCSFLEYYTRTPYSFSIMLYSLLYFHALINGSIASIHARNVLNIAVFLFFTVDLFLAIGMKYFILKDVPLASYFWSIRILLLELFYIGLIYFGWKSSEKSNHR